MNLELLTFSLVVLSALSLPGSSLPDETEGGEEEREDGGEAGDSEAPTAPGSGPDGDDGDEGYEGDEWGEAGESEHEEEDPIVEVSEDHHVAEPLAETPASTSVEPTDASLVNGETVAEPIDTPMVSAETSNAALVERTVASNPSQDL